MFRGSSFHTIDTKGRLIIPARFREAIEKAASETIMVSRMDGALVAYTLEKWRQIEARILSLAQKGEEMRRFRRVFIGGAHECGFDKQERILIPPFLRQYAAINREVVLVGVTDHFEIWARANWDKETTLLEEDLQNNEEVRNEIAKLGL